LENRIRPFQQMEQARGIWKKCLDRLTAYHRLKEGRTRPAQLWDHRRAKRENPVR
jgi:flagellar biosynthesis chaperone FliJ